MLALLFSRVDTKVWRYVDLTWVFIGRLGALSAFIVSLYLSEIGGTQRSIDLVHAKLASVNSDASAIQSKYCSNTERRRVLPAYATDYSVLCDAITSIIDQTADDSSAYQLIGLLETRDALDPKSYETIIADLAMPIATVPGTPNKSEGAESQVLGKLDLFDTLDPGVLAATFFKLNLDSPTLIASEQRLENAGVYSGIAVELRALVHNLEETTKQFDELRITWERLVEQRWLLAVRTIALAMLSFCLPLRIGKSVNEILRA